MNFGINKKMIVIIFVMLLFTACGLSRPVMENAAVQYTAADTAANMPSDRDTDSLNLADAIQPADIMPPVDAVLAVIQEISQATQQATQPSATWQDAYTKILTHYRSLYDAHHLSDVSGHDTSQGWHFILHDIGQNGVPELFMVYIYPSGHAGYYAIYTFTENGVVSVAFPGLMTDGGIFAPPNGSPWIVFFQAVGSGGMYTKMELDGFALSEITNGFFHLSSEGAAHSGDYDFEDHYQWHVLSIAGESVTVEVFEYVFGAWGEKNWLRPVAVTDWNIYSIIEHWGNPVSPWQTAFAELLQNNYPERYSVCGNFFGGSRFLLFDMDNDGVPKLFVVYGIAEERITTDLDIELIVNVYAFCDGDIVPISGGHDFGLLDLLMGAARTDIQPMPRNVGPGFVFSVIGPGSAWGASAFYWQVVIDGDHMRIANTGEWIIDVAALQEIAAETGGDMDDDLRDALILEHTHISINGHPFSAGAFRRMFGLNDAEGRYDAFRLYDANAENIYQIIFGWQT